MVREDLREKHADILRAYEKNIESFEFFIST